MEIENNYEEIGLDPLVIPMVKFFNSRGLKTHMSCQGHGIANMSLFWIEFDESVTEDDIVKFMQSHQTIFDITDAPEKFKNRPGSDRHFISNGRIAERLMLGIEGQRNRIWMYVAATPEAAADDLKIWKQAEVGEIFHGHSESNKRLILHYRRK